MRFEVLIPQPIDPAGVEYLTSRGCRVRMGCGAGEEDMIREGRSCDAILARTEKVTRKFMEACKKLKVIGRHGVGVNNLDLAAAKERNIVVTVTPHANTNAVAEHAMMLVCALSKNVFFFDKAVRAGDFSLRDQFLTNELAGKELGIFGCGRIGRLFAQKAALGFGMKVTCYDPYIDQASLPEYISWGEDMETVAARSDVLSLHLPALDHTYKMVNAEFLAKLKPQACLVNVARGELVDEAALAEALTAGRLAGAAVDVFDPEPPQKDSPLLSCPNVILTPHNAALTREAMRTMALQSAESIVDVLEGRQPKWPLPL